MAKPDDSPFRSGHTAALDLDKLEKDPLDDDVNWDGKPKASKWESSGWGGGADDWPEEFGGGGGGKGATAALDLSEFDPGEVRGGGDEPWKDAFSDDVPDLDAWENNNKGKSRRAPQPESDGFDGFFGGPSGTQALDIGGFDDSADEAFDDGLGPRKGAMKVRRRAERSEDARDPHSHIDQRGNKSYEGGQGDPIMERGSKSAIRGESKMRGRRDYEPEPTPDHTPDHTPKVILDEEELAPHERTMAIGLDELRRGSGKIPMSVATAPETQDLDFSGLRAGTDAGGELFPDEKTQAIDRLDIAAGANVTTTEFDAPPGLRRGKATPDANVRTAAISSEDLKNYQAQEQASGAHLLIFVPGNPVVEFPLRPGVTNIGRERTNHLVLSDPYCSRKHLRIKCQDGQWEVRDNGSDNGTLHNERPMAKQQDLSLSQADEIKVGSTVLRFVSGPITDAHRSAPSTGLVPRSEGMPGAHPQKGNTASIAAMPAMDDDDPVRREPGPGTATPKVRSGPPWPLVAILLLLIFGIGFLVVVLLGLVFLRG